MLLTLYKTSDPDNVINKSLGASNVLNIVLKADVDVDNPIIRLRTVCVEEYNYASLNWNGMAYYYFIRNSRQIAYGLVELELSLDLLETYKTQILNSRGLIRRQIQPGDKGSVDLDIEGQETSVWESDVELEAGTGAVLSVLRGSEV